MGRTAIVSRFVNDQLKAYAAEKAFRVGLLIGQPNADGKDYVIYAPQTQYHPEDADDEANESPGVSSSAELSIETLDPQMLVNHAIYVTRMIPGCFFVQGIFVICEKSIFQDEAAKKVRQCVVDIHKILTGSEVFRSNTSEYDGGEKLVLHFTPHATWTCRSVNVNESEGSFKPIDWKVQDKPVSWHLFETNYDIEEVFPVVKQQGAVNLENNFVLSLKNLTTYLEQSEIFIQHEQYEESMLLEALLKARREKREPTDKFRTAVFFPAHITDTQSSQIVKVNGTIRYSGIVFSRIWVHQRTSLKDVKAFIRNDILRSLASRIQIYCDSLTEANVQEDSLVVSEPPRRVFLKVAGTDGIEFCEYLFRGETADVVVDQAKEMLDLDLTPNDVETEVEALPAYDDDASTMSDDSLLASNVKVPRQDARKNMYLAGIVGAVAILIFSLILHFVMR